MTKFRLTGKKFPKRHTINPYRNAFNTIWYRFLWDIHPNSWKSRRRIRKWKNIYSGQKALILCNGPSLNNVDFDRLMESQIFCFGLNKINLLFSRTDFRPNVIVAVNPFVISQNSSFYNQTKIPLFLDSICHDTINFKENIHFLHTDANGQFARDCSISVSTGYTVTYVAIQLAFHMGFEWVAIAGCDHYFTTTGPANSLVQSKSYDPNHFDPTYFSNGQRWQLPDLIGSEYHYQMARDYYENHGRHILNCTNGGNLEIFERMPLETFLKDI